METQSGKGLPNGLGFQAVMEGVHVSREKTSQDHLTILLDFDREDSLSAPRQQNDDR
jgi:hypothetical protein